jgi:hypothetical protein
MFSGRHHETKRQADGRVFIDRDGEVFKLILQFLRDGDLNVAHLDQGMRERLRSEAAFFCLTGLEEKLLAAASAPGLPKQTIVQNPNRRSAIFRRRISTLAYSRIRLGRRQGLTSSLLTAT